MEFWLGEVEKRMKASVRDQSEKALKAYAVIPRKQWVLQWPAMVVLAVSGIFWAKGVEDGVEVSTDTAKKILNDTSTLSTLWREISR